MTEESGLLTNLRSEIEALRIATREAHEVLSDLKRERKKCEKYIQEEIGKIDDRLIAKSKALINEMGTATKQATDEARAKIFAQFDKLAAILMGEDKPQQESLYALALKKREEELRAFRDGLIS